MMIQKLKQYSVFTVFIGVCVIGSTIVNCQQHSYSPKGDNQLPIDTPFKLPAPIPKWPSGEGFASGTIDLGGLLVSQITSFDKIWASYEGGPDNLGATFYKPNSVPDGFFMLGCYSQPNNQPLYGWVLVAKDVTSGPEPPALKSPTDYTLVWSSESQSIKQDGVGYIWLPIPPDGYKAIGHLVTSSAEKPLGYEIRCVRSDLTENIEIDNFIWGSDNGLNVSSSRPTIRGTQALGVPTGTFLVQINGGGTSLSCLKNVKYNLSCMPNLNQIHALVQAYSPAVYFHPDEEYFPSSVTWFYQNGALLYTKGQESNPVPIDPTGSNLPQNGSDDGAYWLDLPTDKNASDFLKKGNLENAVAYLHVKPTLGATFTDIAVWIFYPFNGAGKLQVEFITISLKKIGEHVGDWEHATLRISNFNGELKSLYFSQHREGTWMSSSGLEFHNDNKPVVYATLHGHAAYPHAGVVVIGKWGIGARNDTSKSEAVMDTGERFLVIGAEYLGDSEIVQQPWLNYARKWGPTISYKLGEELKKVENLLPPKLRKKFEEVVSGIPPEVLGEEGPTGPKWKDNWSGDERVLI